MEVRAEPLNEYCPSATSISFLGMHFGLIIGSKLKTQLRLEFRNGSGIGPG